jgi:photosystem II stability/assembly factor-like uncharacterized protein
MKVFSGMLAAQLMFLLLCTSASFGQGHWVILEHPTTRDLKELSFVDSLNGWIAGDSGTIVMTSDGGKTWETQNSNVVFNIVDIDFVDSLHGWFLAHEYPGDTSQTFGTHLYRTVDGGRNWNLLRNFNEFYNAVSFVDTKYGLMGGNFGKLFWTDDAGAAWAQAVVDSPEFGRWPVQHIAFFDTSFVLAVGGQIDVTGLVWKSTDGGKNWKYQRGAGEPFYGVHYLDSRNIVVVGGDVDIGSGMIRSTDSGESWAYSLLGVFGQATAVAFRTPSEGWAPLGFTGTFMCSTDTGKTWTWQFTPDSSAVFDVVFLDSTVGYMAGASGTILKYVSPTVSVGNDLPGLPDRPRLLQNYPNPFNPSTTIHYQLDERSRVTATVIDMLGREVQLARGIEEPGHHEVLFDAADYASGVYLCKVVIEPVGGFPAIVQSIKMVLLR